MGQIKTGKDVEEEDEEEEGLSPKSIFPVFDAFFWSSLTKDRLTVEVAEEVDFSVELGLLSSNCRDFCFPGFLIRPGVDGFAKNLLKFDFMMIFEKSEKSRLSKNEK
jgi:hypothetical protein